MKLSSIYGALVLNLETYVALQKKKFKRVTRRPTRGAVASGLCAAFGLQAQLYEGPREELKSDCSWAPYRNRLELNSETST